jgi:hypothetical protein
MTKHMTGDDTKKHETKIMKSEDQKHKDQPEKVKANKKTTQTN